ncbi:hypothetical protein SEPCBS57363_005457 [Sporothrix epigloea]|uniref:Uncharacterized protein n=1 Tax=Sporothrix epigloea TaxID=1892477 RepID=A0ABP0DXM2_9PEZI
MRKASACHSVRAGASNSSDHETADAAHCQARAKRDRADADGSDIFAGSELRNGKNKEGVDDSMVDELIGSGKSQDGLGRRRVSGGVGGDDDGGDRSRQL